MPIVCQSPCQYLDTKGLLGDADGLLQPGYDSGDGLHLNRQGSAGRISDDEMRDGRERVWQLTAVHHDPRRSILSAQGRTA